MDYILSTLAPGVFAIAIEDKTSWDTPTYTNFYLLSRQERNVLIDAGMKRYRSALTSALQDLGLKPEMITHVLLTHGHHDHAEGAGMFSKAKKFVHENDLNLLSSAAAAMFSVYSPRSGTSFLTAAGAEELDIVFVNTHTLGSVAIYDPISKAMFAGDFFCFFGEPLPGGELVSFGDNTRRESYQYVADQAAGGEDMRSFIQGLENMLLYHPEFFCTGHGVVLQGKINEFMQKLRESAARRSC